MTTESQNVEQADAPEDGWDAPRRLSITIDAALYTRLRIYAGMEVLRPAKLIERILREELPEYAELGIPSE
jgi:hypothetical protein